MRYKCGNSEETTVATFFVLSRQRTADKGKGDITRKLLKGMGLTEEQMDTIIEAHTDTVDGLKSDLARYKADAEKLPGVQAELENLKAKGDDGWKDKHDKVKKEFDDYKREQMQKETKSAKESAYRELLKSAGISEKRIDSVLKVTDLSSVELEDGKIKNADDLKKSIKEEWADFVVTTKQKGADTKDPPANNGGAMSRDDIFKIKDASERQAAIAANLNLFGKEE